MSDLARCGCDNDCGCQNGFGNNALFIILLLFCCGGCGNDNGSSLSLFGGNSCGCDAIIWILLLSCICGHNRHNSDCDCNSCGCNNCGGNNCGC